MNNWEFILVTNFSWVTCYGPPFHWYTSYVQLITTIFLFVVWGSKQECENRSTILSLVNVTSPGSLTH